MKKALLSLFICASIFANAQNALLSNPNTGAVPTASLEKLCIVSDGTDVVLLVANNSSIYAIDIADNDATNAAANKVTSIPNFVDSKLKPLTGQTQNITVRDMVVNPISNTVYVLGSVGSNRYLFKVEKDGATVSLLDISNISHSKMDWGTANFAVKAMTYGNGTLYASSGTNFSLDGELGWIQPPFAHNATITTRATTLFKTNWGGQYFTTAPLETLTIGKVDGKFRLMGVTTCAPGFSIDVANIAGAGLLTVTEDFNIHYGLSQKDVYQHHDNKDWLFDLHQNKLYRIGKKYLDGSQVTANKYDANAEKLRDNTGKVISTMPEEDIKLMNEDTYSMMAFWDNYRLLVLETGGTLKLLKTSIEPPAGVNNIPNNTNAIKVYPNPATNMVSIKLPTNTHDAIVSIIALNGAMVASQDISGTTANFDISSLASGVYTLTVKMDNGTTQSNKLTIE